MCVYLQAFTGVHSFQCRLKGKESHKTVIIMSLKRMTSGTRGHWVTQNPHLFPSLPPSGTKNPCWFSATICPSFYREARCVRVCVWVCREVAMARRKGGRQRWTGGSHQERDEEWFWMGNLSLFLKEYLGVCPSPAVQEARQTMREMKWEQVAACCLTWNRVPL